MLQFWKEGSVRVVENYACKDAHVLHRHQRSKTARLRLQRYDFIVHLGWHARGTLHALISYIEVLWPRVLAVIFIHQSEQTELHLLLPSSCQSFQHLLQIAGLIPPCMRPNQT